MYPTVEAAVCLQAQEIDDNNGGVSPKINDDDGGVGGGRGIDGTSEGLDTTTDASAEDDDSEDFNNDNKGVGRGYKTRPRK